LTVCKWLDLSLPWIYMSEFFERNRQEYIDRLFRVSALGEWEDWVTFHLHVTIAQSEASIERCASLQALRNTYRKRMAHASARIGGIVDRLFSLPVVRIVDVRNQFKVSYATAKADVDRLVDAGILVEIEGVYPKTFGAVEVMQTAYGD